MKYRILSLEECAHRGDRRTIWLEMAEAGGQTVPVVFLTERGPFLRFDAQDRVLMIEVRADWYGKSWRCWNAEPAVTDWTPVKKAEK